MASDKSGRDLEIWAHNNHANGYSVYVYLRRDLDGTDYEITNTEEGWTGCSMR